MLKLLICLFLNGECKLFAAAVFKAIRWFNFHYTINTNCNGKANNKTNKYTRPNWCRRKTDTIVRIIKTFGIHIQLYLKPE